MGDGTHSITDLIEEAKRDLKQEVEEVSRKKRISGGSEENEDHENENENEENEEEESSDESGEDKGRIIIFFWSKFLDL